MKKAFKCRDCGTDTSLNPRDYYMVRHDLWNKYGLGRSVEIGKDGGWREAGKKASGMLCIDCFELRLGRKIEKDDLLPCLLNERNPYARLLLKGKK